MIMIILLRVYVYVCQSELLTQQPTFLRQHPKMADRQFLKFFVELRLLLQQMRATAYLLLVVLVIYKL